MSRKPNSRCGNCLHKVEPSPTFDQGILWAAARMCDMFDQPTMAEEIIREAGVNIADADVVDREALRAKGIGRRGGNPPRRAK